MLTMLPLLLIVAGVSLCTEATEYCQFESFNATCSSNQVIVIEEAHYGRLRLGRCVTRDYGYLGCTADVTDILDRACSGQRWCHFNIPALRDMVQPCPKDLTAYLDASYRCETGQTSSGYVPDHFTFPAGSLPQSSLSATGSSQQSNKNFRDDSDSSTEDLYTRRQRVKSHQRLTIQSPKSMEDAPSGSQSTVNSGEASFLQRRRRPCVTGYDVSDTESAGGSGPTDGALFVIDRHGRRQTVGALCYLPRYTSLSGHTGGGSIDEAALGSAKSSNSRGTSTGGGLYMSVDHVIGIYVDIDGGRRGSGGASVSSAGSDDKSKLVAEKSGSRSSSWSADPGAIEVTAAFIVRFEAIGCADIPVPENAWMERRGDLLTVRCNMSHETWYLTCKGANWIGGVANCSRGSAIVNRMTVMQLRKSLPFGLLMAVIVGIIIGISFGTVMLVSVFVYRRRLSTGRCSVQLPIVGYGLTSARSGRLGHDHGDCCKSNADNIRFQLMYSGSSGVHPNIDGAGGTRGNCIMHLGGGVNLPAPPTNAENIPPDYVTYFRSRLCHSSSSDNVEREDNRDNIRCGESGMQSRNVIDPPLYDKTSCRVESLSKLSTPMTSVGVVRTPLETFRRTLLPKDVVMTSPAGCSFTRTVNRGRNSVDYLMSTDLCSSRRSIRFNDDWFVTPRVTVVDQCNDYFRSAMNPDTDERRLITVGDGQSTSELQLFSSARHGVPNRRDVDATSDNASRMIRNNFRSGDMPTCENRIDQLTASNFLENRHYQPAFMPANPDGDCDVAGHCSVNTESGSCRPDVVTSPTNDPASN